MLACNPHHCSHLVRPAAVCLWNEHPNSFPQIHSDQSHFAHVSSLLGRIAMYSTRCGLLLRIQYGLSVCLSVCVTSVSLAKKINCLRCRLMEIQETMHKAEARILGPSQTCQRSIFSTLFASNSSDATSGLHYCSKLFSHRHFYLASLFALHSELTYLFSNSF